MSHSQRVAFRRDSTGTRQFFIPPAHVGTMQCPLRSGTALSSELFPTWRNPLMSNAEGNGEIEKNLAVL
jgi:hypothetical protein